MDKGNFRERLLLSSRGKILAHIRGGARTVNELAEAMGLTDNAVRAHLVSLERDGLVAPVGVQAGVRRPHVSYGLTLDAEQFFPKAYGKLLSLFFERVSLRLDQDALHETLREMGVAIASSHLGDAKARPRTERIQAALELLNQLGGAAEVIKEDEHLVIQGSNCPLAALTEHHPEACAIAEALLTEIIGAPVTERCEPGPPPRCCFVINL